MINTLFYVKIIKEQASYKSQFIIFIVKLVGTLSKHKTIVFQTFGLKEFEKKRGSTAQSKSTCVIENIFQIDCLSGY